MNEFKKELRKKTKLEEMVILRKIHPEIFEEDRTKKASLEKSKYSLVKKETEKTQDIGKEPGE